MTSSEAGNLKKKGFVQQLGGLHGSQWQLHLLSPISWRMKVKEASKIFATAITAEPRQTDY